MRWLISGLIVVALLHVVTLLQVGVAVGAEPELRRQFQLYLNSPADWREDETVILQTALACTDPKIRELADERLRKLKKPRPKNEGTSALWDAQLAFDLQRSLEYVRQTQLEKVGLTPGHAELILKSGQKHDLPTIVTIAEVRIPALKRVRQAKLEGYFEETVRLQKTSAQKLGLLLEFDSTVDEVRQTDFSLIAKLRDSHVASIPSRNAIVVIRGVPLRGSARFPSELKYGFRLPRSTVSKLIRPMLDDKDQKVRAAARHLAAASGTDDDFLMAGLSGALRDNQLVHGSLNDLLEHLRPKHTHAKAYLNGFYSNKSVGVRSDIIAAVERTEKRDQGTRVFLGDSLTSHDFLLRLQSRLAMRKLGVSQQMLNRDFLPALKSNDVAVLQKTARQLQTLGMHARPAKAGLERLLTHKNEAVRFRAAAALYRCFDESDAYALPLIKSMSATSAAIRLEAIASLTRFGPAPRKAVPALVTRLGDSDRKVVAAALDALRTVNASDE